MDSFTLNYNMPFKAVQPQAEITVLEPGELPSWIWPGQGVVIVTQPWPYEGVSVTNGANNIAHALLNDDAHKRSLGPFTGYVYVEHYTQEDFDDRAAKFDRIPSFDTVRFKWELIRCEPPYKLRAVLDDPTHWWRPVPYTFYPALLSKLEEPCPKWIVQAAYSENAAMTL